MTDSSKIEPIQFLNITRQYEGSDINFQAIENIIRQTPEAEQGNLEKLEAQLCKSVLQPYCTLTGSGTDAVYFALRSLGIGPGDEVLVTAFSFIASASGILRTGARPVFVDIDPETYLMNLDLLETSITPKCRALLAVHLYGQVLDVDRVSEFCKRKGIHFVEDAAQAFGATRYKKPAGSFGEVSCISFNPTKVIGGFENGGAVLTNDAKCADRVRTYTYHGKDLESGLVNELGFLSRMSEQNANFLRQKIDVFAKWQASRVKIANSYFELLKEVKGLKLPKILEGNESNWHKFVIRTEHSNELRKFLKKRKIESKVHYPVAMFSEPVFAPQKAFPEAERASQQVLSLPIYPQLKDSEVIAVATSVKEFFAGK